MNIGIKICESGGKYDENLSRQINEDLILTGDTFIITLDGATGLGDKRLKTYENNTGAEWFVKSISQKLRKLLSKNNSEDIDIKDIVKQAVLDIGEELKRDDEYSTLQEYEKPSASLSLIREKKNKLEIFQLGDAPIIVGEKNGKITKYTDEKHAELDDYVLKRMGELSKQNNIDVSDARKLPEIENMLIKNRNLKNTENGYWILDTNIEGVDHATLFEVPKENIDMIIIMSDGFDISMLGLNEIEFYNLLKTNSKKVQEYYNEIKNEIKNDPKFNKYPRFKNRDDASFIAFKADNKRLPKSCEIS